MFEIIYIIKQTNKKRTYKEFPRIFQNKIYINHLKSNLSGRFSNKQDEVIPLPSISPADYN